MHVSHSLTNQTKFDLLVLDFSVILLDILNTKILDKHFIVLRRKNVSLRYSKIRTQLCCYLYSEIIIPDLQP